MLLLRMSDNLSQARTPESRTPCLGHSDRLVTQLVSAAHLYSRPCFSCSPHRCSGWNTDSTALSPSKQRRKLRRKLPVIIQPEAQHGRHGAVNASPACRGRAHGHGPGRWSRHACNADRATSLPLLPLSPSSLSLM